MADYKKPDSPGIAAALRALRGRKGPATEGDRPPVSPAPGRKVKPIKGQLDLDGNEHLPEPVEPDQGPADGEPEP